MSIDDKTVEDELDAIEAEASQAEAEAAAGNEYVPGAAPGPEQKKKALNLGEAITGMLGVTFNMLLAPKRGEHWKIKREEAGEAGEAYADVINKHWPDFAVGPELVAIAATAAIFGPRIMIDKMLAEQKKASADKEGGTGGKKSESDTEK